MTGRRYLIELGASLLLYVLLLVASNLVIHAVDAQGGLLIALLLVPMIGGVAAAWAVMRGIWRLDEMQRRIQLDAIAIGFLATALLTFGWGFAELGGAPRMPAFAVWPIMATGWIFGTFVARRRYR